MTEKRFIRNIIGQVYDSENDKFFEEDYVGKPIGYEDDLVVCLNVLHEEKDYWKKRTLLLEKKYNEGDSIEWLRNNTVWEQMPTNKTTYTTTSIDEKNRGDDDMTEKRFEYKNHKVFDNLTGEYHSSNMVSVNVLNALHEEKEALKLNNKLLLEEMKEIRDKLTVYLQIKGIE